MAALIIDGLEEPKTDPVFEEPPSPWLAFEAKEPEAAPVVYGFGALVERVETFERPAFARVELESKPPRFGWWP